jgi:hypothetical protein
MSASFCCAKALVWLHRATRTIAQRIVFSRALQ